MDYDYSELREKIRIKFKTESACASAMGINRTTLSLKLTNKTDFTQQDIIQLASLLSIPHGKIGRYFFTHKVAK